MEEVKFQDLNLSKPLLKALSENGFEYPTLIQKRAFSPIMSGRDVIGIAQTGTGKTFAYLLPLLRLWKFDKSPYPKIIIIVPTRELVIQVVEEIEMLSTYMNLVVGGAYGGANIKRQIEALQMGMDILVATPGRLYDLLLKGALKAITIKKIVIDEVDEMFNLGFRTQIKNILDMLPEKKQSLMFSATMIEGVDLLIDNFFKAPQKIEAAPSGTPLQNIDQVAYDVPNFNSKINLLKYLLKKKEELTKVLVFGGTKKKADLIAEIISEDLSVEEFGVIHSNKSQNFRFDVINKFKSGEYRFIIATDVVARGVDVTGVSHVINFDIPEIPENYIHRIGRTGRADRKGKSIAFVSEKDSMFFESTEELMGKKVERLNWPEEVEVSDILIEEEMPQIHQKNIHLKKVNKTPSGPSFHEKKKKNQKTKLSRKELQQLRIKLKRSKNKNRRKGR